MKRSTVATGTIAEFMVVSVLTKLRFPVFLPITHNVPYDIILQTGKGKLRRLQVKTAWTPKNSKCVTVGVRRLVTSRSKDGKVQAFNYKNTDFDFLVAVDITTEDYWIIPIKEVLTYKFNIYLNKDKEKFRLNWGLLG